MYKTGNKFTLFGFAGQNIVGTNFVGADLLDIGRGIDEHAKEALAEACQRAARLLDSYEGFLGIDFIDSGETINVLEINVRLTAATIPTLLMNASGGRETARYIEEQQKDKLQRGDVLLSLSKSGTKASVLRFADKLGAI